MAYTQAGYKASRKWEAANIKKVTVKLSLDLYRRMTESPDFENMNKFIKEAIEEKLNKEIDMHK